jgi:hypothetical protein
MITAQIEEFLQPMIQKKGSFGAGTIHFKRDVLDKARG